MRRALCHLSVLVFPLLLLFACTTVPVTGRQQLSLVPEESLLSASVQQYAEVLQKEKVIQNTPQSEMVKRVGARIRQGVEGYFREQGMPEALSGYEWEFNLLDSPDVNAWAMPGGKVAVYRGLLDVANTEPQLAAVVGHEIAHVVAKHGNERMSQGLLAQLGGQALSAALQSQPQATQQLLMTAFGAGAQVGVLLPFSRLQENEADRLGMIFMAFAGYDPNAAIQVWQGMAQQGGRGGLEFLSTHPADQTRIRNLQEALPEAMRYYRPR